MPERTSATSVRELAARGAAGQRLAGALAMTGAGGALVIGNRDAAKGEEVAGLIRRKPYPE